MKNREIKLKYVVKSDDNVYVSRQFSLKEIEETRNIWDDIVDDFQEKVSDDVFNDLLLNGDIVDKLQYVGLKDSNDVEIYKGDILKSNGCIWDKRGRSAVVKVIYRATCFGCEILNGKELSEIYVPKYMQLEEHFTIIGNKYENRELLNDN